MDDHTREHLHETPAVVTVPLVLLAIPSVISGYLIGKLLFGDFFAGAIIVSPEHNVLGQLGAHYHGIGSFMLHGIMAPPFWLAISGIASAWYIYMKNPNIADVAATKFAFFYRMLVNKYGLDEFNQAVFAGGTREIGKILWRVGDAAIIDGLLVNGSARVVGWVSSVVRHMQTGYLYHYAFAMIVGLLAFLSWAIFWQ